MDRDLRYTINDNLWTTKNYKILSLNKRGAA